MPKAFIPASTDGEPALVLLRCAVLCVCETYYTADEDEDEDGGDGGGGVGFGFCALSSGLLIRRMLRYF